MNNSSAKFVKIVFRLLCSGYVFLVRKYLSTFSDKSTKNTKTTKKTKKNKYQNKSLNIKI